MRYIIFLTIIYPCLSAAYLWNSDPFFLTAPHIYSKASPVMGVE